MKVICPLFALTLIAGCESTQPFDLRSQASFLARDITVEIPVSMQTLSAHADRLERNEDGGWQLTGHVSVALPADRPISITADTLLIESMEGPIELGGQVHATFPITEEHDFAAR